MNGRPPLALSDFAPFFRAVHGYDPFPWQERLADLVVNQGWPGLMDLPTGTGKTAALDVAVFALALSVGGAAQAPRRVIYVVDRRTVVSQAHDRAIRIRDAISGGDADVLVSVRGRLASISGGGVPLRTVELRGGIARDDMWSRTPDQPLIAVSTVDQVGSRLLFRGYGVSDSMKPIHAGLLGNDVLYLLDEVHLSQPFKETLTAVATRYRSWAEAPGPSPFVVVEMSATPGEVSAHSITLNEDDRRHPLLSRRLGSSKPVTLVAAKPRGLADEMVRQAEAMFDRPGATVGIVVNRVKAAREVHQRLRENGRAAAHLVTGRMRPFDRDALDRTLLQRIRAGRKRSQDEASVVVVATQTIEAGADFDFDGLVTECASLDAIRQRFGRMDRLGELDGKARGVIVAPHNVLEDDPVYGLSIGKTWEWLRSGATGAVVDFGLEALQVPTDAVDLGLLAPRAHAPILLPAHMDAWVQTSPIPVPDPDVALWLHGPERGTADVQIVWRADLTETLLDEALRSAEALELVLTMVEVLPPVSAETMSVPYVAVRRWLERRAEPNVADVEGAPEEPDDTKGAPELKPRPALVWRGEKSEVVSATALRPGQTIVVPADYGGIAAGNWDPNATDAVSDVAEAAAFKVGRPPVLRLHDRIVSAIVGVVGPEPNGDQGQEDSSDDRGLVSEWLTTLDISERDEVTRDLVESLRSSPRALRVIRLATGIGPGSRSYLVASCRRARKGTEVGIDDRVFADGSGSSFTGVDVSLRAHQQSVATLAAAYAERVGLGPDVVAAMRVCGEWHDRGKLDFRFQRWLCGGSEFKALVQMEPMAKSVVPLVGPRAMREARERAGYPKGGRHELMSVALMTAAGESAAASVTDWALAMHIVATHHGQCRPFAPWVHDENPVDVVIEGDDRPLSVSSAHRLERLDSGVAERFWLTVRKYGWWGSAYLEAIFRLADQQQSAREQRKSVNSNG
jgi:CRISPR-associated endonuclease/helicase Cas3